MPALRNRPTRFIKCALALGAAIAVTSLARPSTAADKAAEKPAAKEVDFAKDIQPILKESCTRCHQAPPPGGPGGGPGGGGPGRGGPGGPRGPAGGLRLDDATAALKGGKHGKAIVPGNADESLLYKLLKGPTKSGEDNVSAMPKPKPKQDFKPLPDAQIELIKNWIDQGAKWGK
jgi:hypothetical protein